MRFFVGLSDCLMDLAERIAPQDLFELHAGFLDDLFLLGRPGAGHVAVLHQQLFVLVHLHFGSGTPTAQT